MKMFQLDPGICCSGLSGYLADTIITVSLPCGHFGLHGRYIGNPALKALPLEDTEFNLCHVQPAAVFGRIMNFKLLRQPFGFLGANVSSSEAISTMPWVFKLSITRRTLIASG